MTLLAGKPARVHRQQHRRLPQSILEACLAIAASNTWSTPPQLGLRRQPQAALRGGGQRGPPGQPVRTSSKKANELMAHTYSHLFGLPTTGLRFFTVYGPWGRPDMALFLFTKKILRRRTHRRVQPRQAHPRLHLHRRHRRRRDPHPRPRANGPDPTHDPLDPTPATSSAPYRVYNIGNNSYGRSCCATSKCWKTASAARRR